MNTKLNTKISTPIRIDPNTDLNTITECGFYYCDGANNPNRPIAEGAFSLLVENTGAWGGRARKQTFTPYNHNTTYTRIMTFNADGITINWYPWTEISAVGHTHDASQISGVLPANKGGTGVTSIDALKNVLGIGSSSGGAINAKFVAGIYNGTYPDQSTQTITVSALTSLYGVLILNPDGGTYYNRGSGADMYLGGMASTLFSTRYIEKITPGTNTFTVTSRSSNYGAVSLNSGPHYYFAFGT